MQKPGRKGVVVVGLAVALVPMAMAYGLGRSVSVQGSRASCLDWVAAQAPKTTTSPTWVNVPGMQVRDVLAQNFTLQMSGTFDGSDVELRVLDTSIGGSSPLMPGSTTIRVGVVPAGYSFTWVGSSPAEHQHTFRLQWRLPTSGSATMMNGDLSLSYQGAPTAADC